MPRIAEPGHVAPNAPARLPVVDHDEHSPLVEYLSRETGLSTDEAITWALQLAARYVRAGGRP
jgi:hypothetical protein